jgi:KaiC protein
MVSELPGTRRAEEDRLMAVAPELLDRVSTGIGGLDEILYGGLIPGWAYLVRGGPGSGKTTVGLHFLTAGEVISERALFITLGEPETQIRQNAQALGFKLTQVAFLDLSPNSTLFTEVESYDIFSPAEVEREPTTHKIIAQVEALKPQRVFRRHNPVPLPVRRCLTVPPTGALLPALSDRTGRYGALHLRRQPRDSRRRPAIHGGWRHSSGRLRRGSHAQRRQVARL